MYLTGPCTGVGGAVVDFVEPLGGCYKYFGEPQGSVALTSPLKVGVVKKYFGKPQGGVAKILW